MGTEASHSLSCSRSVEDALPTEWKHACYFKYCAGRCDDSGCRADHDLSDDKVAKFKEWVRTHEHTVWGGSDDEGASQESEAEAKPQQSDDEGGVDEGDLQQLCSAAKDRRRRRTKLRPCKGKRDQYRKLVDRMVSLVDENPDTYNLEDLQIPPSVMANERLLKKFTARAEKHAAELCEHHGAKEETGAPQPSTNRPDIVSL